MNKSEIARMNKSDLLALVSVLVERTNEAEARAKATPAKARVKAPARTFRIVNAEKACLVGTPLKDSHATYAKGKTFAVWHEGEVKRRAYDGGSFLVVDTRGVTPADVADIAKAWNPKATGKPVGECVVFTKVGK